MKKLRYVTYIQSLIWILLAFTACSDEGLLSHDDSDGMSLLNLQADFSPFAEGDLTRASNVAPARGFNSVSDIAILVFDRQGKLLPEYLKEIVNPAVSEVDREDKDAAYNKTAEDNTKRIEGIPLILPPGVYYIVGVANYGAYECDGEGVVKIKTDENGHEITSLARLRDEIESHEEFTLDDLRGLKVVWNDVNYADNRAMLGFFTDSDSKPYADSMFETVTVNGSVGDLHAWLRRCASKITVDFDGSGLRDNVSIFIKDVRIYDLARECTLGFGNSTSLEEDRTDFNNHPSMNSNHPSMDSVLVQSAQCIEFGEGAMPDSWPRISRRTPYIMNADGKRKNLHTQDSECLYFYENMQGTKDGYDRSPKPNLSNGGLQEGYNSKDGVPFGTYIEVSARHMVEENGESVTHDIKYRFMIGKNAIDNFDAERNHHYKLTLGFTGTADEYHWHIDYAREDGFKVPNPWYVSYVYNHDATLPFEFNLGEDWEIQDLVAEIETNPWYPTTSSDYSEGNDNDLFDPGYVIKPQTPDGDESYPYVGNPENKNNCNGFLSLRMPSEEAVLTDARVGFTYSGYNNDLLTYPEKYYNGLAAGDGVTPVNHGKRDIIKNANPATETGREAISVKRQSGVYSIDIPLFTRERALVKQTGYSGNNPFVGYQRVAKVKLTAKVRKIDDPSQTKDYESKVNVVQVRRVVNPKGVYRKEGNNTPFHVNLKFLTSEREDGRFEPIISRGPWMAEVLGDDNFITLDGRQRVTGSSRSQIDFTINFNRMGGSGNKNAIVRIKYHNYTCTHLIFVRQGYEPQAICGGGRIYGNDNAPATEWNTFNMVAGDVMADDPRDEGSLFKYGNAWNSISSIDNIYKDKNGNPIYYEQSSEGFTPHETLTILSKDGTVNKDNNKWATVGYFIDKVGGFAWENAKDLKIANAATMRDFEQLYLTRHVEFGYGVLYADGATVTQSTLEMVNGWYRDDPSADKDKKGMRGVFAYYWDPNGSNFNARNIFFPIGRSGYGHRKNNREDEVNNNGKGILRYAAARPLPAKDCGVASFQKYAPLFEFLYRRMGAIYWAREMTGNREYLMWNGNTPNEDGRAVGLDLNYFTFDVNAITIEKELKGTGNLSGGADACFVRTVSRSAVD